MKSNWIKLLKTAIVLLSLVGLTNCGGGGGGSSPGVTPGVTTPTADVTSPVTTAATSVSGTTGTATTLSVTINENGTGYYLVQLAATAVPSVAAVQTGTSFAMTGNVAATQNITGLTPSTAYIIYFIAKDAANNVQAAVESVAFTTAPTVDVTPPVTTAAPSVSGTTGTTTTLSVTINENGTGYYLVQLAATAVPSVAAVQTGTSFAMTGNVAATQNITGLTPSTAYIIYFIAKDAANNVQAAVESVPFTTAPTVDVTPPVTTAAPSVSGTTGTTTTFSVTINENGTGYYLVQLAATAVPSVAAVQTGTPFAMSGNVAATQNITGLTPSTAYIIYFIAKDAANNVQAAVERVEFTTAPTVDVTPPVTTAAPSVSGTTSTATTLSVTINENGTGYYLVQPTAMAAPSVVTVQAGTSFAMTANVAAIQNISSLTPSTAYTIYFVAKDVANNVQATVSSVAVPVLPASAASTLNDTGITASQCYQAGSTVLVACNSAGAIALNNAQDGMVGRDANPATNSSTDGKLGFSFSAVTGGCVQDNVTGLMWEVKTTDGGLRDWNKTYTNRGDNRAGDATAYPAAVNATNLCLHNDWRLPTAEELQSIVDYGVVSTEPTIDASWFPNTKRANFWSAWPYVGQLNDAYAVHFGDGGVEGGYSRLNLNYVRLVRAGQPSLSPRYTVSSDAQEVTDSQTKLIWRRCAEGMVASGDTCTGTASTYFHEAALKRAAALASSTGVAWRLPNVKELSSIVDKSRVISPLIDPTAFPATPSSTWFWSASPCVGEIDCAMRVSFDLGFVRGYGRNVTQYVRLVRAGQ